MQLITFRPGRHKQYVYIGQAERLRCEIYTDEAGGIGITGERVAIHQIVERLCPDHSEMG